MMSKKVYRTLESAVSPKSNPDHLFAHFFPTIADHLEGREFTLDTLARKYHDVVHCD